MAEDNEDNGGTQRIEGAELRQFFERFERIDLEKKDLAEQQKEITAELKGRGYDPKIFKIVLKIRARDRDDVENENAMVDTYLDAVGR